MHSKNIKLKVFTIALFVVAAVFNVNLAHGQDLSRADIAGCSPEWDGNKCFQKNRTWFVNTCPNLPFWDDWTGHWVDTQDCPPKPPSLAPDSTQPADEQVTSSVVTGFNCDDNQCYDKEISQCINMEPQKCGTNGTSTIKIALDGHCVFSACQENPGVQAPSIEQQIAQACEGVKRCTDFMTECVKELPSFDACLNNYGKSIAQPARPAEPAAPADSVPATGGQPAAPGISVSPDEEEGPGCDGVDSVWGIWEKGEDGKFSKLKQEKSRLSNDPQCGFKLSQAQQDEIAALERARSKDAQQDQAPKRTVTAVKVNGRDVGTKNPKVPLNLLDLCKDDFFAGKCIVTVEYFYSSGDPKRIALKLKPASSLTNKESGQPCNKTAQCKQGLICIGDDDARESGLPKDRCYPNPKVTTKLPDGADCVSNSQCVTGDCRTGGTCDTPGGCKGKCIGGGKPGEFCRHHDECPSGYFCPGEGESAQLNIQKDRCTPLSVRSSSSSGGSSSSSSCGTTQRQPSGSKCLGQSCSQDSECKTGYCCTGSSCTNKDKCTNANGSI